MTQMLGLAERQSSSLSLAPWLPIGGHPVAASLILICCEWTQNADPTRITQELRYSQ